ncbi:GntR family transcriptional regulator [Paenibacillus harenae]|uniref:GntR family transcriptional regulator n=1 Tax=Paenibacillus harenae TaxID=306543 RepID=UPI00041F239F|nr:GntR family transcriptional regulator [Paenibacillus harenae]
MHTLNRDLPIPLYYQIYQILESELADGSRKPGDFYSTEVELQSRFKVSRATIRNALTMLENGGHITRITGKGIHLASEKVKVDLLGLISFSEEMRRRDMIPGTRLLGVSLLNPPKNISAALLLKESAETLLINRIRTGDGNPIVYSQSYLPSTLGMTLDMDYSGSLYEQIQIQTGRAVSEALHVIEGAVLEGDIAKLLGVDSGFPGLRFRRTAFDEEGTPLVYEEGMIRADKYSYEVRLKRG